MSLCDESSSRKVLLSVDAAVIACFLLAQVLVSPVLDTLLQAQR